MTPRPDTLEANLEGEVSECVICLEQAPQLFAHRRFQMVTLFFWIDVSIAWQCLCARKLAFLFGTIDVPGNV